MQPLYDKDAARAFAQRWAGKGNERSDTQAFWIELLGEVFGVERPTDYIRFERDIKLGHVSFLDAFIPSTHVLIEQKSLGVDLDTPQRQSDGTLLTPFRQAARYNSMLPYSERARWIVVSDFARIRVYDMETPEAPPRVVTLANLADELDRLDFLVNREVKSLRKEEETLSVKAGEQINKVYGLLLEKYFDAQSPETLRSLNMLCVRIVFCLYADDAGLFGKRGFFYQYFEPFVKFPHIFRLELIRFFRVLDTPQEQRDRYERKFYPLPYVNGGLFADDSVEVPEFSPEAIHALMMVDEKKKFDWSGISPTIFGAVFESTLNPETRRTGGMHYTSVENIHRVIDPLFLDRLRDEFDNLKAITELRRRRRELLAFQECIAAMTFFDPACGSGNFLTETYLSLRRLENEVVRAAAVDTADMAVLGEAFTPIRVSIDRFYGIEINDFAVVVARTAMWIAETGMKRETASIVHHDLDFFPLRSEAHIAEDNALRLDWRTVCPSPDYIIGNPPFVGARLMNKEQKDDLLSVFGEGWKNVGNLDYVSGWYKKAADMMKNTPIRAALVSTNSIVQGESIGTLWKSLFADGMHFDFAYRSFRWESEMAESAQVYCVIIGFSMTPNDAPPRIYIGKEEYIEVKHINAYLIESDDVFVESRTKPLCGVPEIGIGNQPIDDGNYLFTAEERDAFIKLEPEAAKYFRPFYGAQEFINNKPRYCLWLGDCSPAELRRMPHALKRVEAVRQFRLKSKRKATLKLADKPTRFQVENMPDSNYLLVPKVSTDRRQYVPIGYMTPDVICSDLVFIIPSAGLYHFGILTSSVHNAWLSVVCGRLGNGYRYSKDIVYNNFPWPTATDADRAKIEATAEAILDARAKYPDSSLADLYDAAAMPPDLRRAHSLNDAAVLRLYGLPADAPEPTIVAHLMNLYKELTAKNEKCPPR
nr:MAG TPA: type I restriction-modification system methyltransferase [Caudoviricetes sp.]